MLETLQSYIERFQGGLLETLADANAARARERQSTQWRDKRFRILCTQRGFVIAPHEIASLISELSA